MRHNPDIDKAIPTTELQNYRFTKVYNFNTAREVAMETNFHPTGNRIDIFAELANLELDNKQTVYVVTPAEKEWARDWIKKNIDPKRRRLIGIQVSATTMRRTWPAEKQGLLAFRIIGKYPDTTILFFSEGTPVETEVYPNFIPIGGMPLRWTAALINECELMVVPDSGLMHLAGALKKRMIALFGPNPPRTRILYYPNAVGIWLGYPCAQQCWYERCWNQFKCMEIPVEMVWEQVEKLLRGDIIDQSPILKDAGTLVLRMGGIGDLILLSSSLKAYKEVHPDEKLIFATSPQHIDVLKDVPFLDKIIPIPDSYKSSFYKVIDLRYKIESPEVGGILDSEIYKTVSRSDVFDRLMGLENAKKDFYVNVDEEKVKEVKKAIGYSKKYRYIGIQVTCTSNTRTIPPEYVPEIVKQFRKVKDLKIVVFGNEEFWHGRRMGKENFEKKKIGKVRTVNLMGETNQAEMIALCSIMDYIISPDSAAVHIAGALRKKCLGLFGNMDPYLRIYYYPTVKALYPKNELPCVPCYDFCNPCEYYKKLSTPNQPIGGECMRKLTPERIFQEAKEWFEI
jgi:ADP-heptose:LPS heptosyltransferase